MQKIVKEYLIVTFATLLIAIAIYFFMIPSNVVIGSISGLSMVISNLIPIPMSVILFAFNAILLIIGFMFLGREFGAKTVYSALSLPIMLSIFEIVFPNNPSLTKDIIIDTVCYLLLVSIAQAILFHINASSGGTDIIAKLMNRYLHVDIGNAIAFSGICIALTSVFVYDTKTVVLGLLATYANGIVVDNYINGFNRRKRVCVISDEYEQIQQFIMNNLNRGVTLYQAVGGFNNDQRMELVTILTRSEYGALMSYLNEVDAKAFVTVSTVNEVIGNWNRNKKRR
jgi:uncharacterized membrane-anchored protein YitT (DUF2179 family)